MHHYLLQYIWPIIQLYKNLPSSHYASTNKIQFSLVYFFSQCQSPNIIWRVNANVRSLSHTRLAMICPTVISWKHLSHSPSWGTQYTGPSSVVSKDEKEPRDDHEGDGCSTTDGGSIKLQLNVLSISWWATRNINCNIS